MASYSEKDIDTEEDYEWTPPTEAEMKISEARRERSDRISKIMGGYLLKGFKMLSAQCTTCGTILLEDRQQKLHCVGCEDVDSDILKDDPALNEKAASSQRAEQQFASEKVPAVPAVKPRDVEYERASATMAAAFSSLLSGPSPVPKIQPVRQYPTEKPCDDGVQNRRIEEECSKCLEAVLKTLEWTRSTIETVTDPVLVSAHVKVMTDCAGAIAALQKFTR